MYFIYFSFVTEFPQLSSIEPLRDATINKRLNFDAARTSAFWSSFVYPCKCRREQSAARARGGDQLNFRIVGTWKIRGRLFILLQSALLPSCASSAKTANLGGQCSTWKTPEAKRLVPVPPAPTSTVADWDAAACFKGNVSGQMTHLAP